MKFKVGDKVKALGVVGTVKRIDSGAVYPIIIKFDDYGGLEHFTGDGKIAIWAKEPSLVLIELPKVKKKVYVGIDSIKLDGFYGEFLDSSTVYLNKESYNRYAKDKKVNYKLYELEVEVENEI